MANESAQAESGRTGLPVPYVPTPETGPWALPYFDANGAVTAVRMVESGLPGAVQLINAVAPEATPIAESGVLPDPDPDPDPEPTPIPEPDPEAIEAVLAEAEAIIREAGGEHFYGAWHGGSAGSGGASGPAPGGKQARIKDLASKIGAQNVGKPGEKPGEKQSRFQAFKNKVKGKGNPNDPEHLAAQKTRNDAMLASRKAEIPGNPVFNPATGRLERPGAPKPSVPPHMANLKPGVPSDQELTAAGYKKTVNSKGETKWASPGAQAASPAGQRAAAIKKAADTPPTEADIARARKSANSKPAGRTIERGLNATQALRSAQDAQRQGRRVRLVPLGTPGMYDVVEETSR